VISLPDKYRKHIAGQVTSITKMIRLEGVNIAERKITISGDYYEDRGLRVGNIKQSVDLTSRNFRIGGVGVTISNFKIDGKRFSDLFSQSTLINKTVEVYFVPGGINIELEDCLKVFEGKVRRYTMNGKTVNLSLEDSSQEKMHKDLPLARVIDSDRILEQYRNVKVPMVFGYNDKSPLYYYKDNVASNEFTLLPDNIAISRGDESDYNWGGRIPIIQGFNLDLQYGEEPVRAFKGDWIEIPSERSMVPTTFNQYILDTDRVRMVKDTSPLEDIQQRYIDEELTEEEYAAVKFENMSPIANNIFEGFTILRPESFTLLDKYLAEENYPDTVNYDTYYMGKTGVNNNTEKVEVEKNSEDVIDFNFPKEQGALDSSILTGVQIGYWKNAGQSSPLYTGDSNGEYSWYESDYYYYSSKFGSASTLLDRAMNAQFGVGGNWWITVLPNPDQLLFYLYSHMPYMGYPLSAENGVTGTDTSTFQGQWRGYRTPQNEDPTEQLLDYANRTGHSCGSYDFVQSGILVNNLPSLVFQLKGNQKFCEWWFGVDENGNLGAPTDEFGRGHGPVIKDWTEVNDYQTGQHTMSWFFEYVNGGGINQYITWSKRDILLNGNEYYRWIEWQPDYYGRCMRWSHSDSQVSTGNPICFFNPDDLSFHTAGEHDLGHDASDGLPYTRMSKTGFTAGDMGYEIFDDPSKVTVETLGNILKAVRFVFNFPDLETKDVVAPFYKKDQVSGEDVLAIQTYKPSFYFNLNAHIKCITGSQTTSSPTNFEVLVDYLPAFTQYPLVEGDEAQISNAISDFYSTPGLDQTINPTLWQGPNDFNDIGVTLAPQQLPLDQREIDVSGRIHDVQIRHTCNYDKLDKTQFYGRIKGRKRYFKIHPYLSTTESSYTVSANARTDLQNIDSEYWNLYPLFAAAFNPPHIRIETFTGDELQYDYQTTDEYVDKLSIWDFFYTGILTLNDNLGADDWNLFGEYGGPTGATLGGLMLGWAANYYNSTGDHPVQVLKEYIDAEIWLEYGGGASYELAEALFNQMVLAFELNLNTQETLMENPIEIIGSLLYTDLNFTRDIDMDKFLEALNIHQGMKLGFTVSDEINSKDLIEGIASNTRVFPKLRPSDGSLSFVYIKPDYRPEDVDEIISIKDMITYKYSQTKIDNVKNKVRVIYKPDPGHKNYEKATDFVFASDIFPDYNTSYYNLETESEDTTLEFESDYIRDEESANQLRDFLCAYHCNQKLTIDLDIALSYSHLETGDVVYIDDLPEGVKAYGDDFTGYNYTNGQIIFPYFIVQEVSIAGMSVKLSLQQLHFTGTNQLDFESYLESVGIDIDDLAEGIEEGIVPDVQDQETILGCTYSSASNYNPDATIDDGSCEFPESNLDPGDVNGDGFVDILDIVSIINSILDS
tara:strand:- start:18281 stop:22465 length:4185 start_codon:yes stop_codon:yes gene_type:complete